MAWRSCFVPLRLTGGAAARSPVSGGRWPLSLQQQRCGFRKAARKPESRRPEEELGPPHAESPEAAAARRTPPDLQAQPGPTRAFSRLLRPLVFTVGFTGCCFGSAAIWQYESLKSRVQSYFDEIRADWLNKMRPQKRGDVRKERSMIRYFTANPASKTLCSPMLLSTFSHFSFFHLAANMYVLWSFSSSAVSMLGREQFMAVYLSAGVISTFVSYVCKTATGRLGPSLGASGAIMTVLAAVCTKMPEAKLAIIFLPMFTFTAGNFIDLKTRRPPGPDQLRPGPETNLTTDQRFRTDGKNLLTRRTNELYSSRSSVIS
ncbi:Presenilins-associated rhomboid-like protein, mitochondrial [Larimichthys crocea]|nr:Presenilins-associated rhomboid-like protein, mitochondrial [Larimichthys crocea]